MSGLRCHGPSVARYATTINVERAVTQAQKSSLFGVSGFSTRYGEASPMSDHGVVIRCVVRLFAADHLD